jgi:CRISPR-associated protein Csb2
MGAGLRITVRFLQSYSHGRGEDGAAEWPPSPLRLFQAVVASSLGPQPDDQRRARAGQALRWLERQAPPEIFAPRAEPTGPGYRLFVPDNVGDKVAKAWSAGREANMADYRTEKDVRPVRLEGEAVHFVYREVNNLPDHLDALRQAARSITHLGWGIDMAIGDATDAWTELSGERWIPGRLGGRVLRCPVDGTLDDLGRKHAQFLGRLEGDTLRPVSPLSTFTIEAYGRAADAVVPSLAAFRLLDPSNGQRLSLDPTRRSRDVAAWTRHAVADVCVGWPFGATARLVHGHADGDSASVGSLDRLSFLPLPTINAKLNRAEGVARVAVVGPPNRAEEMQWIRARLGGRELAWQGRTKAILEPLPIDDWVLRQYAASATTWTSVTPVVLPGYDDRSSRKAERLLRKAFLQAGFPSETVATIQELDWRKVGFYAGVDHANRFLAPDKVTGPMFHVRARFAEPVSGPISIGSGRFRGMGMLTVER